MEAWNFQDLIAYHPKACRPSRPTEFSLLFTAMTTRTEPQKVAVSQSIAAARSPP